MTAVTLYPHWREAVKQLLAGGLTYGSVIPRTQIVRLCKLKQPTTVREKEKFDLQLLKCTSSIRDELLREHQMWMVSDNRGSYLIVAPKEQTQHAVAVGAKAIARELTKTAEVLVHTNTELLTDEQRRQHTDAQAKWSQLARMNRGLRRELRELTEK